MRSTLGFPSRRSKSNATCVSTHSIWLCYFRNLVQSQPNYGLTTIAASTASCLSSQRVFFSSSTKAKQQRWSVQLLLLAHLDHHMPYLIKPSFTHRHFRVRSKPLLATASVPSLSSKEVATNGQSISSSTSIDPVHHHDSSMTTQHPSNSTTVTMNDDASATNGPHRRMTTIPHPRWYNKTNNIQLQLLQLDENRGHLKPSFIFKTLRSMLYNTTQYNYGMAWQIYQAMIDHQVKDYMGANHYGHLLNMIKYAPNATPMLLTILDHMKAAQDKGLLVIGGRHYSQIMYGMSRQGDVVAICDILRTLSLNAQADPVGLLQPSWYTSLAMATKKHNDLAMSVKAAQMMEQAMKQGVVMEKEACAVMISALSVDIESTAKFLTTMKEVGMMTMDNISSSNNNNSSSDNNDKYTQHFTDKAAASAKYNVHIYTSLISGLARKGDAINARRLWKDMRDNRLRPTPATYAAMIEAYGRSGDLKAAISLMKKYTYGNKGELNKVMVTSVLTNTIRHGELNIAKSLLSTWVGTMGLDMDKMDMEFRSAVLWVKVMDDMEHARAYFESLYNKNATYVDSMMVNHLVHGYGNTRQKQKVLDSFRLHDKISPSSSSSRTHDAWPHAFLVDALFKCRDVPAALSAMVMMRQYSIPDEITLAMVIRGLVMNDESRLAWTLFQKMKSDGVEPNLRAYSSILKACIQGAQRGAPKQQRQQRQRQQQQQQHIPDDIIEAALKISNYNTTSPINDNQKLGPTQAYILFRKMTGFQKPNVYTYTTLIACFAKHNLDRAMDVFLHMRAENVEPVLETYVALLQGCAIFRNGSMALKIFHHLREESHITPNGKIWHYMFKALVRSRTSKSDIDKFASLVRRNEQLISGS